jgi:toxin FitB
VLDTDIASLLWRSKLEPTAHEKLRDRIPTLTFVTHAEWWQWSHVRRWGRPRVDELLRYAHSFQLLHCDYEVVKAGGRLSGSAMAAGTTVPANDCWIAACCVVHDYPLLSGNAKQFAFLEPFGLRLL